MDVDSIVPATTHSGAQNGSTFRLSKHVVDDDTEGAELRFIVILLSLDQFSRPAQEPTERFKAVEDEFVFWSFWVDTLLGHFLP